MRDSLVTAALSLAMLAVGLLAMSPACRAIQFTAANNDLIFADGFETLYLLEVTNAGGGTVTSDSGAIDCGVTCSAKFREGSNVTLQARTTNGSGSNFSAWSGDCAGSYRDCVLNMTAARSATATFANQNYNLVFVTSATFPSTLGSAAAYDAQCNTAATNAGINNTIGNAFVAWVSSSSSHPGTRLGTTGGWVRLDGEPFAFNLTQLTMADKVFNSIDRDEFGAQAIAQDVMTGTDEAGATAADTCANWTSGSGFRDDGDSSGGPGVWSHWITASCSQPAHVYCLMKTLSTMPSLTVHAGKRVWITNAAYTPGSATPNVVCNADRPPGVASAKAVIATSTVPAAAALSAGQTYVRPDGQIVGTGAEISAANLRTGIWQTTSGVYFAGFVAFWSGDASDLTTAGTLGGTCTDWTSTTGNAGFGIATLSDPRWWNFGARSCSTPSKLICAEQ